MFSPSPFSQSARKGSLLHRTDPSLKLGLVLLLLIAASAIPPLSWLLTAVFGALVLAAVGVSRLPLKALARRLLLLSPFIAAVSAVALFQENGARLALFLATKSALCLTLVILLAWTTPFNATLAVLRRFGVPRLLVTTISLMYRYLFVLTDEVQRMQRARRARTFSSDRGGEWKQLPLLISRLFERSSERADRIYGAMRARGWQ